MSAGKGDGRRIARFEKEVQIQVAQYLVSGFSTPLPGLVTVASVKMPADLRTAKVFVSVLGADDQKEEVIELLQERAFEIQDYIGRKLQMRYCPKLTFMQDFATDQVLKIERILNDISKENRMAEGDSTKAAESEEEN